MSQIIRGILFCCLIALYVFLGLDKDLTNNNLLLEYISDFGFPAAGALVILAISGFQVNLKWASLINGYASLAYEMYYLFIKGEGTPWELVAVATGTIVAYFLARNGFSSVEESGQKED